MLDDFLGKVSWVDLDLGGKGAFLENLPAFEFNGLLAGGRETGLGTYRPDEPDRMDGEMVLEPTEGTLRVLLGLLLTAAAREKDLLTGAVLLRLRLELLDDGARWARTMFIGSIRRLTRVSDNNG